MRDCFYSLHDKTTRFNVKPTKDMKRIAFQFTSTGSTNCIDIFVPLLDFEELIHAVVSGDLLDRIKMGLPKDKKIWESDAATSVNDNISIKLIMEVEVGFPWGNTILISQISLPTPRKKIPLASISYRELRKMSLECQKFMDLWYKQQGKYRREKELLSVLGNCSDNAFSGEENQKKTGASQAVAVTETTVSVPEAHNPASLKNLKTDRFKAADSIREINKKNGLYAVVAYRENDKKSVEILFQKCYYDMNAELWNKFKSSVHRGISFTIEYLEYQGKILFYRNVYP